MSSTKTVGEQLSTLLQLQDLDSKIYTLSREKRSKPLELEILRQTRDTDKQKISVVEKELIELQLQRKNKEIDLETKEGVIKKYQIQLYQIKTNKEYQSLQKEIETLKADNSVLEEEILQVMEDIDQRKEGLTKQKDMLRTTEEKIAEEERRVTREIEEIEKLLATLKEKRQTFIPDLDRKLFERYDRILINKEGLALVPIKGHACGGCHMNLPPQVINEVQLQEKVIICENCSRILYDRNGSS